MFSQTALEKTKTLKDMERMKGTEGSNDYFVVKKIERFTVGIKFSFMPDTPAGARLFCRIRIVPAEGITFPSMSELYSRKSFNVGDLRSDDIDALELKTGQERCSFVLIHPSPLEKLGNPSTVEGYKSVIKKFPIALAEFSPRITKAISNLGFNLTVEEARQIDRCCVDAAILLGPPAPEEKPKATVTNIGAGVKVDGEPTK